MYYPYLSVPVLLTFVDIDASRCIHDSVYKILSPLCLDNIVTICFRSPWPNCPEKLFQESLEVKHFFKDDMCRILVLYNKAHFFMAEILSMRLKIAINQRIDPKM